MTVKIGLQIAVFLWCKSICTEAYRVTPHYTKDNEYHQGTHAGVFILSVSFVKVLIALAVMNK
jgi:hypothetical protein